MHDITLFGEVRCHKTRFYQSALEERGLAYELPKLIRTRARPCA